MRMERLISSMIITTENFVHGQRRISLGRLLILLKKNIVKPRIDYEIIDYLCDSACLPTAEDCKKLISFFSINFRTIFDRVMRESSRINQMDSPSFSDGETFVSGKSLVKVLASQLVVTYMKEEGYEVVPVFEKIIKRDRYIRFRNEETYFYLGICE